MTSKLWTDRADASPRKHWLCLVCHNKTTILKLEDVDITYVFNSTSLTIFQCEAGSKYNLNILLLKCYMDVAAVAQWVELVVIRRSLVRIPAPLGGATCQSILEQDTEPRSCRCSADAIGEGPAMSWQLFQGEPWPMPIVWTGFGPSKTRSPSGGNGNIPRPSRISGKKTKWNVSHKFEMISLMVAC